jgi:hypothetical protein
MKFAPIQYLFARNWPAKIFFAAAAMLGLWLGIGISMSFSTETGSWLDFILLRITPVIVLPVLAFFVSLPSAWMVLGPLYYFCSMLNGAPYHTCDHVRILVGPFRDRVGQIYAVWEERGQVRGDLGLEMKDVRDVFAFTQVCRESAGGVKPK